MSFQRNPIFASELFAVSHNRTQQHERTFLKHFNLFIAFVVSPRLKLPFFFLRSRTIPIVGMSEFQCWKRKFGQFFKTVNAAGKTTGEQLCSFFEMRPRQNILQAFGLPKEIGCVRFQIIPTGYKRRDVLQAGLQFLQLRSKCPLNLQFVRTKTEFNKLAMSQSLTSIRFFHHRNRPRSSRNGSKTCNQRLKIVKEAPEAICLVAADKGQHAFDTFNLVSTANQLSYRLKGYQNYAEDQRKDPGRNPRHRFASAAGISHYSPASVEPLPAQSVDRDWQEGKAA